MPALSTGCSNLKRNIGPVQYKAEHKSGSDTDAKLLVSSVYKKIIDALAKKVAGPIMLFNNCYVANNSIRKQLTDRLSTLVFHTRASLATRV